jgi:uncharacterized protein
MTNQKKLNKREFLKTILFGGISLGLAPSVAASVIQGRNGSSTKPGLALNHVPSKKADYLHPISLLDINIIGDLLKRSMKNFDRLEEEQFKPAHVFLSDETNGGWPGYNEGLIILGLTMDAQATHRDPLYLDDIFELLPQKLNPKGYFGKILPKGEISEQQLVAHGWLLHALCEYYSWKNDKKTPEMIKNITANLMLPASVYFSTYPVDPSQRPGDLNSPSKFGAWWLSSENGSFFMLLDGLMQTWQLFKTPELKKLIDVISNRFLEFDPVANKANVHSVLTACKALLNHYRSVENASILNKVEEIYLLYCNNARTENYEGFEQFGNPEKTDPSATIDSLLIATLLWNFTNKAGYLEDAHCIYLNGIELEQRFNGGFGPDTCSGGNNQLVEIFANESDKSSTYGGEGLSRAMQYSYFLGTNKFLIPFYNDNITTLRSGQKYLMVRQATEYPFNGYVKIEISETEQVEFPEFGFFAPSFTSNHKFLHNKKELAFNKLNHFLMVKPKVKPGDIIELTFDMEVRANNMKGKDNQNGSKSFSYGALLLGYEGKQEINLDKETVLTKEGTNFRINGGDLLLSPLRQMMDKKVTKGNNYKKQILFKD